MSCDVQLAPGCSLRGYITHARGRPAKPVSAFLGVPYAEAPTGARRFLPPEALQLWHGERLATEYGAICVQDIAEAEKTYYPFPIPEKVSEDCLFLNVWSPDLDPKVKLPVMIWIHGGGFVMGFSNYYDGTALAAIQDVVVVSINYRVGALGFLYNEAAGIHGNMGLLDQLEALRWVQRHISLFGGDARNVTVFGESGGAISISSHILSPLAHGLFHRAICQSGVILFPAAAWTSAQATKYWLKRLQQQGLSDDSAEGIKHFLDTVSSVTLAKVITSACHVIDGHYLPMDPHDMYCQQDFNKVDLVVGFNANEGLDFVPAMLKKVDVLNLERTRELVTRFVTQFFFRGQSNLDAVIEAVMERYILSLREKTEQSLTIALVALYGDLTFVAPGVKAVQYHSKVSPSFLYLYAYRRSISTQPNWALANHGEEIPLVIGEPFLERFPDVWSDEDKVVSRTLMAYWTNFAKTGNPNGAGLTHWPHYDAVSGHCLTFGEKASLQQHYERSTVTFWNEVVPAIIAGTKHKL